MQNVSNTSKAKIWVIEWQEFWSEKLCLVSFWILADSFTLDNLALTCFLIRRIRNNCPLFFNFSDQKNRRTPNFSLRRASEFRSYSWNQPLVMYFFNCHYISKSLFFSAFLDKVKEHFNLVNATTTTNQILKHGNLSVVLWIHTEVALQSPEWDVLL